MIRNRYNDLTPSVQDTKGNEDALKATAHTLQAEFNYMNSTPQQRLGLGTVSKNFTGGGWGGGGGRGEGRLNRFYVATTLVLSSAVVYTQDICSVHVHGV